jgi:hypothetical protein
LIADAMDAYVKSGVSRVSRLKTIQEAYGLLRSEAEIFISLNDELHFTFKEFIPLIKALPKTYGSTANPPLNRLLDSMQWFFFVSKTLSNLPYRNNKLGGYRRIASSVWMAQNKLIKSILMINPDQYFDKDLMDYYKFRGYKTLT